MNYRKLYWGFIFLIDFRIGGFDILPDIIGYILIAVGLAALIERSNHYKNARLVAIAMAVISIVDIYRPAVETGFLNTPATGFLNLGLSILVAVLSLTMVHGICMGIAEEATGTGNGILAEKARSRWTLYLVITLIITFGILVPVLVGFLFIPILILSIVSFILILNLLRKAENEIWGRDSYYSQTL